MGLWSTVKGWFNVGGVKVSIIKVEDPFPREDTVMKGAFTLTAKTTKTVLSTSVEFYSETTTGKGEERKTERKVHGRMSSKDYADNEPFDVEAGETVEKHFTMLNVKLTDLSDKGGVVGAIGKVGKLASKINNPDAHTKYFIEVTADVKGTAFDPTDKYELHIRDGKTES